LTTIGTALGHYRIQALSERVDATFKRLNDSHPPTRQAGRLFHKRQLGDREN